MRREKILKALRDYKEIEGKKYGVQKIGIFGSAARGAMIEGSDLDVVVSLQEQDLFMIRIGGHHTYFQNRGTSYLF